MGEIMGVVGWDCDRCGKMIHESHPRCNLECEIYCWGCSFIMKIISEADYLAHSGIWVKGVRAAYIDDEIKIWVEGGDK